MNKERATELLPVIQALAEGKEIEYFPPNENEWVTTCEIFDDKLLYRVKPESPYRPFENRGEMMNAMLRSPVPFGWIRFEKSKAYGQILHISDDCIVCSTMTGRVVYNYEEASKYLTFLDGTPFGVKKE